MKLFVQSTKPGGKNVRFEVISFDPATQRGKIKGRMGKEFEEDLSKEFLIKNGYKIVKEE